MSSSKKSKRRASTLAALLEEKPKRGRPPRNVSRQNVYVALSQIQKEAMNDWVSFLPKGIVRADLPDLAIVILAARLEGLRRDVSGRDREIPEGITDMESLYLLWDLALPVESVTAKWTSIRVSPQQIIELGRAHGLLNAVFGVNRSQTFSLGLALLGQFLRRDANIDLESEMNLGEMRHKIRDIYL